jgi:hypothetical protein
MSNVRIMTAPMTMTRFIGLTSTLEHSQVDAQARSIRQRSALWRQTRVESQGDPEMR